VEKAHASGELVDKAWAEARQAVTADERDLVKVWLWGLEQLPNDGVLERHEALLRESMGDSSFHGIHELLLMRYATITNEERKGMNSASAREDPAGRIEAIRHVARAYLPTARVWARMFALSAEGRGGSEVLGEIIEMWGREDGLAASVAWAGWLMKQGEGQKAKEVIVRQRGLLGVEERHELERLWTDWFVV